MSMKSRTRSLERIDHKIEKNSSIIEDRLSELLARKGHVETLEVGFGWGRALMQLAWRFRHRDATFHGVDLTCAPPVERSEDLREIGRRFDVASPEELAEMELPRLHFYDATSLHFPDESVDLVYSAVAIRFIARKADFLQEVCRVLTPGGVALLQMGESNWDYPYGLATSDRLLTTYRSRLVLRYGDELIPVPTYFEMCAGDAFRCEFRTRGCVVIITKLRPGRLPLDLDYNEEFSAPARDLGYVNQDGKTTDGFRAVYDVRPERYAELFERGFLAGTPATA